MSSKEPRSWAASILGSALMVLAACYALNLAAHLIVAVLPILAGSLIVGVLAVLGWKLVQRRGSGW